MALLGPSGSGKTTLLRILGGLEFADSGSVRFADLNWLDMPARERRAGFVFQQYALFKHMTVAKNIAFGLDVRPRKTSARPRGNHAARGGIAGAGAARRSGQAAIPASSPAASASAWRWRARSPSNRACCCSTNRSARSTPRCARNCASGCARSTTSTGVTTIFVTHDQEEAFAMADLVAVMNGGRIEQYGQPEDVKRAPQTSFVSEFLSAAA